MTCFYSVSYDVQNLFFYPMESYLSILGLISWATGVLFRKSLPISISWSVFLFFPLVNFKVPDLSFKVFNTFWINFCRVLALKVFNTFWINFYVALETEIYFQSSTCGFPVFSAPFVEEIVFSPKYVFLHLSKSGICSYVGLFSAFF
jgi:hypothetical protein